jgi:DNA-binding beta-propeller fold protein YncE
MTFLCSRVARTFALLAATLAVAAPAALADPPPKLTPSVVGETPTGGGVFRYDQGIGVDPTDGSVFVGDEYSGQIQKFTAGGRFLFSFSSVAMRREPGRLNVVGGVAVDKSHHVFVVDSDNDRISVFSAVDGRYLTSFGDRRSFFFFPDPTTRPDHGIAASGATVFQKSARSPIQVYVADGGYSRLEKYTLNRTTLQPTGPAKINTGLKLRWPQGVGVDPTGKLAYVADDQHHRVVIVDTKTMKSIRAVGSFGNAPGQFNAPYDVSIDNAPHQQMYVADNLNGEVDVFDAKTLDYVGAFGGNGKRVGRFEIVRAVASGLGTKGGVIVGDSLNNRVQVLDPNGKVKAAWGIAGRSPGYVTRARGVAFAADGGLAVADTWDHRVELFGTGGAYAGQYGPISRTGFAAPSAAIDRFLLPGGVAYDGQGNLWVADTGNHRVKRIDEDGTVSYISPKDSVITPQAVAADDAGNAYVADSGQDAILKITPFGTVSEVRGAMTNTKAVAVTRGLFPVVYGATSTRILDLGTGATVAPPPGETAWDHPQGIVVADDGTMYVSEARPGTANGARVVRGTPTEAGGYTWDTIATEGRAVGQVIDPAQLALSPDDGTLAVADAGNTRIQRFDLPGHGPTPVRLLTTAIAGGADLGSVASAPGGIDCGTDCFQHFAPGAHVTLTATAFQGAQFDGWTGACSGTAVKCTVTLDASRSVGARFSKVPVPAVKILSSTLKPTSWHLARKANKKKKVAARAATEAELAVELNEPAVVRLRVLHLRGGRFVAQAGGNSLRLLAGQTVIPLTTRFGGRTFAPGRYRFSLRARDDAGRTSTVTTPTFTVAR